VVFIDELDGLTPRRGMDESTEGTFDRIVSVFLVEMDGVQQHENQPVTVVAASQRPEDIDEAILRPGRLGTRVFVGPPEDEKELELILCACLKDTPILEDNLRGFFQDLSHRAFVKGQSRAHYVEWIRRGIMRALTKDPLRAQGVTRADFL